MNKKVCLISTGQLTTDPRLLKEVKTLLECGFGVTVIVSFWVSWADKFDKKIINDLNCKVILAGGSPGENIALYYWTRLRSKIAKFIIKNLHISNRLIFIAALSRTAPELIKNALKVKADLYIAHNLGALPAAVISAGKSDAKAGFDAEDFHSGENCLGDTDKKIVEYVEKKFLPKCHYITASSEPISCAYARKYGINKPSVILNAFPLVSRQQTNNCNSDILSLYWFSQTISPGRGLEEVIRAVGMAKRRIKIYLQGNISREYRKKLLSAVLENGLDDYSLGFLPPVAPDELSFSATRFDIGLALEQKISLNNDLATSNKIFVYLVAGLSIIATRTTGQESVINSIGKAGWSYKIGDLDSLVSRLIFLFDNREALIVSKKEALKQARECYNWDLEKHKFLEVISRTLN